MTGRLAGRKALIAGASTGIGRATAERFAGEGAELVLFGLGGASLDTVTQGCGGIAVHGDVTCKADIAAAVSACGARLDILVNAVGIIQPDAPLTVEDESWERIFSVNVGGAMALCRAALPLLIRSGRGAVVNVASVAAFNASPATTSYAASKAALVSYTRSLAHANGGDGLRANCVAPGWVRTPMSAMEMALAAEASGATPEQEFEKLADRIALRRIAAPEEIAACCLFLASDEASFVTGAVLVADGGGRSPTHSRAA